MKIIIFLLIFYPSISFSEPNCDERIIGHVIHKCIDKNGNFHFVMGSYTDKQLIMLKQIHDLDEKIAQQEARIAYIQSVQNTAKFLDDVEKQRKFNKTRVKKWK